MGAPHADGFFAAHRFTGTSGFRAARSSRPWRGRGRHRFGEQHLVERHALGATSGLDDDLIVSPLEQFSQRVGGTLAVLDEIAHHHPRSDRDGEESVPGHPTTLSYTCSGDWKLSKLLWITQEIGILCDRSLWHAGTVTDRVRVRELTGAEVVAAGEELLRIQHAAYALEAALLDDDRIPPLHEDLSDLLAQPLRWLAALDGSTVVGALGFTGDAEADIDRLIVDPVHHRRGIGAALVRAVLEGSSMVRVSTGRDNAPARALYAGLGFEHTGDREVLPCLWVSTFVRRG